MEIIQGIAGIFALAAFAAILGFDVRNLAGLRSQKDDALSLYDDPNSTMGVTRDVVAEQLDPNQSDQRATQTYSQNWSRA